VVLLWVNVSRLLFERSSGSIPLPGSSSDLARNGEHDVTSEIGIDRDSQRTVGSAKGSTCSYEGRGSRRKHCSENTVPDRGTSSRHGPASYAMPPPSYRDEHDEHMLRIRPNGFIRGYAPAVIALSEPSARVERETQRD